MEPQNAHFLNEQDLLNLAEAVERQGEADWALFLSYADRLEIGAGDVLIRQHDTERTTFVLTDGELEVTAAAGDDTPQRIAVVRPVAIFGEQTFLDGRPRSATIAAVSDSVVHRLALHDFDRLRLEEPEIACAFLFDVARSLSLRQRGD